MNQNEVIKSISYNQHEILYNIMQLYNGGKPFDCDMTYSKGKFYGKFIIEKNDDVIEIEIPKPRYRFDVEPQTEDTVKIEPLKRLPLEDGSVDSIVVDLPFVISKGQSLKESTKNSNIMQQRFSYFPNVKDLIVSYYHALKEANRVLKDGGIIIWKCQRTITGGKTLNTPEISWYFAESMGLDCVDSFQLLAKRRLISGKHKQQQHSRSYSSTLYVFKKASRKKIDFLQWLDDDIRI